MKNDIAKFLTPWEAGDHHQFGELLVSKGMITQDELLHALEEAAGKEEVA